MASAVKNPTRSAPAFTLLHDISVVTMMKGMLIMFVRMVLRRDFYVLLHGQRDKQLTQKSYREVA